MQIDNPLVSIVLAVYKPNMKWFGELLDSLNNQSYSNIELLIWDDCPESPTDEDFIATHIQAFEYTLYRGEKNMGSNYAFERLTELSNGSYISYCDQDDIWNYDKVETMVDAFVTKNVDLVYSDLSVIDGDGKDIFNSITKLSKRHVFLEGNDLFKSLIVRNVVVGCAMMVKAEIAKEAIPFDKNMVHDHWIALYAASKGYLYPIKVPLIKYRIHGSNQTGVLKGIQSKDDYYKKRILGFLKCAESMNDRFQNEEKLACIARDNLKWAKARVGYYGHVNIKDMYTLLKYRDYNQKTTSFELLLPFMPEFLFRRIVQKIKEAKI